MGNRTAIHHAAAAVLILATSGCVMLGPAGPASVAALGGVTAGIGLGAVAGAKATPDSSQAMALPGVPIGSAVRMSLKARDLPGVDSRTRDTLWLRGARTVIGRIHASTGDTIRMTVSEVRLGHGRTEHFQRNRLALAVPPDSSMRVQVLNLPSRVTNGMWTGAGAGMILGLLAYLYVCLGMGCFGGGLT